MKPTLTRRTLLRGGAATAGAALLAPALPRNAAAARTRVTVRIERDIQNMDPANRVSTVESNILLAVHRGLVRFKPGSIAWESDAAAEMKLVSPTALEFALKPGIQFQRGYGEMTAEDVKFSYERFLESGKDGKKPAYAADWAALDHVEVLDKYRGRIVLKNPAPSLSIIALCSASGIVLSKKATQEMGDKMLTQAVGAGRYEQSEWVAGERVVLKRNPTYLGAKAPFEEIVLKPVTDAKTAELAFRNGEVDFTQVDLTLAGEVAKTPNSKLLKLDGIDYIWIGMNVEKPPLDDLKVRQAIRAAIDVDAVLAAAWDGKVKPARALIPPQILGHWDQAPVRKRDVTLAKRLLAESGHGDGLKVTLTALNQATYRTAAQVAQANLKDAGIECVLDIEDPGSFWSAGKGDRGKTLELSLQLFKGKFDPSFFTQWFVSSQIGVWNWQRWSNPEFDRLDKVASSTLDTAERVKALVRMQQLMEESAAFVWLTHDVLNFATRSWLRPAVLPNGNDWQLDDFREA